MRYYFAAGPTVFVSFVLCLPLISDGKTSWGECISISCLALIAGAVRLRFRAGRRFQPMSKNCPQITADRTSGCKSAGLLVAIIAINVTGADAQAQIPRYSKIHRHRLNNAVAGARYRPTKGHGIYRRYAVIDGEFRLCQFSHDSRHALLMKTDKEDSSVESLTSRHTKLTRRKNTLHFYDLAMRRLRTVSPHPCNKAQVISVFPARIRSSFHILFANGVWGISDPLSTSNRSTLSRVTLSAESKNDAKTRGGINWTAADGIGWKTNSRVKLASSQNGEVNAVRSFTASGLLLVEYEVSKRVGTGITERMLGIYSVHGFREVAVLRLPKDVDTDFLNSAFLINSPSLNLAWLTKNGVLKQMPLQRAAPPQVSQLRLRVPLKDMGPALQANTTLIAGGLKTGLFTTQRNNRCVVFRAEWSSATVRCSNATPEELASGLVIPNSFKAVVAGVRGGLFQLGRSLEPIRITTVSAKVLGYSISRDETFIAVRMPKKVLLLKRH